MIWFSTYTLTDVRDLVQGDNVLNHLGIEFTAIGLDHLRCSMPVDNRTLQPFGILHGGATCVLAETVGSVASGLVINPNESFAVGSFLTANHLRPVESGLVFATAKPLHLGRTKHVWDILVDREDGKLVAKCELTCAITPKNPKKKSL